MCVCERERLTGRKKEMLENGMCFAFLPSFWRFDFALSKLEKIWSFSKRFLESYC